MHAIEIETEIDHNREIHLKLPAVIRVDEIVIPCWEERNARR
ncbi:hypothetical protein [Thiocystis minor]|nr:hypothetical protein [Thiocystis minor]